ncbi:MAG: cobalt ECF transporter T component CbiQ, partial [Actinobacteria bacterium]|nr:cobalt ECF transporter T component CbiQ [Actinomycetota bacterium]
MEIDRSAWDNRLARTRPEYKLLGAVILMAAAFLDRHFVGCTSVLVLSIVWVIGVAGVKPKVFLPALAVPLAFLVPAVLPLAFDFGPWFSGGEGALFTWTHLSVANACTVAARSFACMAAMLAYAYTTPMVDTLELLARLHVPDTIIEVMSLTYRSLFSYMTTMQNMVHAQTLRGGYCGLKRGLQSLSVVLGSGFSRSFERSRQTGDAMMLRGGETPTRFLSKAFPQ